MDFSNLALIFQREYLRYAFIVGIMMAISCALLGVSLVLKKHSMIGDGLSHVGFGAVAVAACMGWAPLPFAIPVVIISSFLILLLAEKSKVFGDSAIAVFSTTALALGYAFIEISEGVNFSVSSYLYGSLLGVSTFEVVLSCIITFVVVIFYLFLYHKIFSTTFDPTFSKSTGTNTTVINIVLSILTSLTVVVGMKVIGALLITSLIIFPTLSARQLFKTFKNVTLYAIISGIIGFIIGLILACVVDRMPIGSSIVLSNFTICIISLLIKYCIRLYKFIESKDELKMEYVNKKADLKIEYRTNKESLKDKYVDNISTSKDKYNEEKDKLKDDYILSINNLKTSYKNKKQIRKDNKGLNKNVEEK